MSRDASAAGSAQVCAYSASFDILPRNMEVYFHVVLGGEATAKLQQRTCWFVEQHCAACVVTAVLAVLVVGREYTQLRVVQHGCCNEG